MNKIIRAMATLADTWFCQYCGTPYNTYAGMAACVDRCYQERYGSK